MARETREIWKRRVERWADSGRTAKQFAAEIGVNAQTLAYWKWRFSSEATPRPRAAAATALPSFVEVVAPLLAEEAPSTSAVSQPLELVLPRGLVIRVPPTFDAESLRRVVDVLGGR